MGAGDAKGLGSGPPAHDKPASPPDPHAPQAGTCEARWKFSSRYHYSGALCGREATQTLTAGGTTMQLCPYHAWVISTTLAERHIEYQVSELPKLPRRGRPGLPRGAR